MYKVELIPIFNDNYIFLITDTEKNSAILVDPGESSAAIKILKSRNLKLSAILVTHHHADHIGGVAELKKYFQASVWAPLKNKNQIQADHYVSENQEININALKFHIMYLPGHTLGHIAYWCAEQRWLFSGDVLFGLGCGRLFEGNHEQSFESLQKIKSLPDGTQIFCTHEYTENNLRFCKTLENFETVEFKNYERELKNKRNSGAPSVPLSLTIEKKVNPFLLAASVEDFRTLRQLRDTFS